MEGFTTVKDSVILELKELSNKITQYEDYISFGIGNSDIELNLINCKNRLKELIEGL